MNNGTPSRRLASPDRRASPPLSSSGEQLDVEIQPVHLHQQTNPQRHQQPQQQQQHLRTEEEIDDDQRSRASLYDLVRSPDDLDEDSARILRDECEKLVRDFNVKVAIYREKLISIADFGDCSHFRHEVRRYRRKCLEAAKVAKTKLYPHMRGCKTRPEFERLFIQLTGCMEMYVNEMIKSLILLQIFPVDALRGSLKRLLSSLPQGPGRRNP
ncbi:regulator of G-protein signaling 7-binding protein B-like [Diadema antillarum]|uniref:regulator of G-protein signaling 7-binding protein B-like n=1 Tax=Diadema antillarum TaxID=105358 RepID=UPI003A86FBC8